MSLLSREGIRERNVRGDAEGKDTDRTVNSDTRGSPWRTDARTMLILPDIKLQVKIAAASIKTAYAPGLAAPFTA